MKKRRTLFVAAALVIVALVALTAAGCGSSTTTTTAAPAESTTSAQATTSVTGAESTATTAFTGEPVKLTFGVSGVACEAMIFAAYEEGFFEKYGLEVDLQTLGFEETKIGLSTGKIDAVVGNFGWIKPIQEGLQLKYVGGIHKGCITGVAPEGSDIKSPADLKGKRLGVNALGDGPHVLALTAIKEAGLSESDVDIKVYPADQLPLALQQGEIDAFINWDPYAAQYIEENGGHYWFENNVTPPFDENWCCHLVLPTAYLEKNPEVAQRLWAAVKEATLWVGEHPEEAAALEVEHDHVAGEPDKIAERLVTYGYEPTTDVKPALLNEIESLILAGVLDKGTDAQALLDQIWFELPQQ